jgi:hypothetical protein
MVDVPYVLTKTMQDLAVETIDVVRIAIEQTTTVQEIKRIIDAAHGYDAFIQKAKKDDKEASLKAAEIILRSERKLGEMLQAAKAAGQIGRGFHFHQSNVPDENITTFTLEQAGIDRKLSMRSQQISAIPKGEFEKVISNARDAGKLSKNMFSKKHGSKTHAPKPDPAKSENKDKSIQRGPPIEFTEVGKLRAEIGKLKSDIYKLKAMLQEEPDAAKLRKKVIDQQVEIALMRKVMKKITKERDELQRRATPEYKEACSLLTSPNYRILIKALHPDRSQHVSSDDLAKAERLAVALRPLFIEKE